MDMYSKPSTVAGTMPLSSVGCTVLGTPKIMWVEGPVKSTSNRPTLQPSLASESANAVATMLLPTPPLPLETAIIRLIRAKRSVIMLVLGSITRF
jgi:hypothetical protein